MLRHRNNLTLNRRRAYLDDPMWLLNEACRKLTGCDLPAGFTTDDWKYKLEDDRKKGVRDPLPLMKNPFATTNYYGLDTKIMRINLLNELKSVQSNEILFKEIHYKLPFYKGFALFLTDTESNPTITYSQRGTTEGDNPTWLEWFYSWEKELFEYIYEDKTSKLYFPLSKQIINTIAQFFRQYLHNAFEIYADPNTILPITDCRSLPDFVPNFLTYDHPLKSVASRWRKNDGDIDYDALIPSVNLTGYSEYELGHLMPIFIAANFNPDIKHTFKKVLKLVKNGKELVDITESEKRASKLVRDIQEKKGWRTKEGSTVYTKDPTYTTSYSLRNRPNAFVHYSQNNNYCENSSVKVAKFNWIESFWTMGTIQYLKRDYPAVRQSGVGNGIGYEFRRITERRKNAWEYVKKHSGLLGENEDYYAHKKYKEHHAGNITNEIMSVMF